MSMEQDKRFADEAEKLNQSKTGTKSGILGYATEECARPGLRERVKSAQYRARVAAQSRDRMDELAMLLDKHPDIARILDLIKEVR